MKWTRDLRSKRWRAIVAVFLCILAAASLAGSSRGQSPVEYVDPSIDTHNSRWFYFSSAKDY